MHWQSLLCVSGLHTRERPLILLGFLVMLDHVRSFDGSKLKEAHKWLYSELGKN